MEHVGIILALTVTAFRTGHRSWADVANYFSQPTTFHIAVPPGANEYFMSSAPHTLGHGPISIGIDAHRFHSTPSGLPLFDDLILIYPTRSLSLYSVELP